MSTFVVHRQHLYAEAGFVKYYNPEWDSDEYAGTKDTSHVRAALTQAVKDQMMSDVPIGLLLSGGLDSAVISSIIKPMLEVGDGAS